MYGTQRLDWESRTKTEREKNKKRIETKKGDCHPSLQSYKISI